ncbi:hypothetical protein [Peribacillus frigoritolerans]|uniref:hypothetical protein n=1 Tax=Peribacillus frigoritolerans TaxID=450367 RepID=UPI0007BF4BAE|nr:hypothetical protein [Peribacillus frigoritolerans]
MYVNGKETTGPNRTTTRITFGCARNVIFLKGNINPRLILIQVTGALVKSKKTILCIVEGFEYVRQILTLFDKQSNLFESMLVLLENNHARMLTYFIGQIFVSCNSKFESQIYDYLFT